MTRAGLLLLGLAVGLAGTALHQSVLWLAVTALAAAAVTAATPPAAARLRSLGRPTARDAAAPELPQKRHPVIE